MKQNGIGGANTKTGLIFEGKTDLKTFLNQQKNYFVDDNNEVFYNGESVAFIFKKYGLYKFFESRSINWKDYWSKRLLPDDSIYVIINNTFYVIECKFQKVAGSVDEKLQTCDFKKKQYKKIDDGIYNTGKCRGFCNNNGRTSYETAIKNKRYCTEFLVTTSF